MAGWDDSSWDAYRTPLGTTDPVNSFAESLSKKIGLDPYYTKILLERESGGLGVQDQINARSSAGAQGPAQVMPETAQEMAKKYGIDVSGPSGQTEAGLRYYKEQLDAFGDPAKAAAAYHSGPGRVRGILDRGGDLSKELGPVGRDYYSWFQKKIAERPTAAQDFQAQEGVAPPPATTSTAPVSLQAPQEPLWKSALLGVSNVAEKAFELPGLKQFNEAAGAQKRLAEENIYSKVGGYDPESTVGSEILKGGMGYLKGAPGPVRALGGAALGVTGALADIATDPLVWEMSLASAALGAAAGPEGVPVGGAVGLIGGFLKNSPRIAKGLATGLRAADLGFRTGMAAGFLTETPRGLAGVIENPGHAESWAELGGGSVSGYFLVHPFLHKQAPLESRVNISVGDELTPVSPEQKIMLLANPGVGTLAKIYDQVISSRWQILREKGIAPDVELPEMHLAFGLSSRANAEVSAKNRRIALDFGHLIADASALGDVSPTERSVFLAKSLSRLADHELTHLLKEDGLEHGLPEDFRREAAELTRRYKGEIVSKPMDWAEYVAAREELLKRYNLTLDTAKDTFGYAYDYVTKTFGDGDLAGILAKMAKHTDPIGFIERFKANPEAAGRELNLKEVENLYQNLVQELGGLTQIFPKAYMEQISQGLKMTPEEILARQAGTPLFGVGKYMFPEDLPAVLRGRGLNPPPGVGPTMLAEGEKKKPGSLKGRRGFSVDATGPLAKVRSAAEHPEYAGDVPRGELVGEAIPTQREARLEGQRMKGATARDLTPLVKEERPGAAQEAKLELEKQRLLNQIARQRKQASGEEEGSSFGTLAPEEQTRIVEELFKEKKISDSEYNAALDRIERGWNKPSYTVRPEPMERPPVGPPPEGAEVETPFRGDLGQIPDLQRDPRSALGPMYRDKSYMGLPTLPEVKKLDKGAQKVLGQAKPPALRTQKGLVRAKVQAKSGALPEPSLPLEFSERVLYEALGRVRKINLTDADRARLKEELKNSNRTPWELEKMIAREAGEPIPEGRASHVQRGGTRSRIGDAVAEAIAALRAQGKDVSRFLASGEKTPEERAKELIESYKNIGKPKGFKKTGFGELKPVERKKTLSAEESIGNKDLQYADEWADVDRGEHARMLAEQAKSIGAAAKWNTPSPVRGTTAEEALSQRPERAPVKKKKEFLKAAKTFDLKPQARAKTLYAADLLKKKTMKASGEEDSWTTPEKLEKAVKEVTYLREATKAYKKLEDETWEKHGELPERAITTAAQAVERIVDRTRRVLDSTFGDNPRFKVYRDLLDSAEKSIREYPSMANFTLKELGQDLSGLRDYLDFTVRDRFTRPDQKKLMQASGEEKIEELKAWADRRYKISGEEIDAHDSIIDAVREKAESDYRKGGEVEYVAFKNSKGQTTYVNSEREVVFVDSKGAVHKFQLPKPENWKGGAWENLAVAATLEGQKRSGERDYTVMQASGENPKEARIKELKDELEKLNVEPANWTVEDAKRAAARADEIQRELRVLQAQKDLGWMSEEELNAYQDLVTKETANWPEREGIAGPVKFLGKGRTMHAAGEEKKSPSDISNEIIDKYTKRIEKMKAELQKPKSISTLLERTAYERRVKAEEENARLKRMLQPPPAAQRPLRSVTPETSTEILGQERPSGPEVPRRQKRAISEPEAAPEVTNVKFPLGAKVEHQEFGPGTVENTYAGKVKVKFEDPSVGTKLLAEEFVRLRKPPAQMKASGEKDVRDVLDFDEYHPEKTREIYREVVKKALKTYPKDIQEAFYSLSDTETGFLKDIPDTLYDVLENKHGLDMLEHAREDVDFGFRTELRNRITEVRKSNTTADKKRAVFNDAIAEISKGSYTVPKYADGVYSNSDLFTLSPREISRRIPAAIAHKATQILIAVGKRQGLLDKNFNYIQKMEVRGDSLGSYTRGRIFRPAEFRYDPREIAAEATGRTNNPERAVQNYLSDIITTAVHEVGHVAPGSEIGEVGPGGEAARKPFTYGSHGTKLDTRMKALWEAAKPYLKQIYDDFSPGTKGHDILLKNLNEEISGGNAHFGDLYEGGASPYTSKVSIEEGPPTLGAVLKEYPNAKLKRFEAAGEDVEKIAGDLRPEIIDTLKGKLMGMQHAKGSIYRGKTWEELNEKLHELPRRQDPEEPMLIGDVVDQMRSLGVTTEEAKPKEILRGYDPLWEKLGAPRAVITSLDLSGILRQGVIGTARMAAQHPVKLAKAIKESISSLKNEEVFKKSMKAVEDSPDFELLRHLGVDFARSEEQFGGARFVDGVFNKLTGGKFNFVRGSERAYTYYLNRLRYELGKHHIDSLRQLGFNDLSFKINEKGQGILEGKDAEAYRRAAAWVNIATGRGQLPQGPGQLATAIRSADKFLNFVLFSPRLMMARIATLNPGTYIGAFREMSKAKGFAKASRAMMSIHGADMVAYAGLVGGVMGALKTLFPDAKIEDDMTSSDFGQVRMGNTRVDVTGGLRTYFTAVARILSGETTTEYGVVKPQDQKQTIWNFIRGKFGPLPALAMTLAEGKNLVGDPAYGPLWEMIRGDQPMTKEAVDEVLRTTGGTLGAQTVIPMILTDMYSLVTQNNFDPLQLTALMGGSVLGMGVSTRTPPEGITPKVQEALRRVQAEPMARPTQVTTPFKDALGNAIELKLPYMVQRHLQQHSDKDWYGILDSVVAQDSFKALPPAAQRVIVLSILTDARQMRSPRAIQDWGIENVQKAAQEQFVPKQISRLEPPPAMFPRRKRASDIGDWFGTP